MNFLDLIMGEILHQITKFFSDKMLKYLILVSILKILESEASFHSLSASELDINGSQVNMNYKEIIIR